LFYNTPIANEHLGNLALNAGKNYQALSHYKIALDLNTESVWVYKNLAEIQRLSDKNEEAIKTMLDGINKYPSSKLLLSSFEEHIFSYWQTKEQEIEALAISQSRDKLIIEYERTVKFIICSYDDYFRRNSKIVFTGQLNPKRVLIIGLTSEAMPQCFRYRIEQKLEQLKYAGYEAETISWYEQEAALNLINFYDCIIFYRVPAFSNVLKLVEYAKYLGKITFYELDDLLFEPYSVPPIESYGGQISLSTYTNITKDIAATRAIASQCDYAIASTLPLLEKLASLTKTKMGYLHRNGLDKYNPKNNHSKGAKATVNLFYGSGTLAHNSDFIIEALPAISRIMREHKEVTLTIMGYLVLQNSFLVEFKSQIIQIPFCKDIEIYSAFLSASDINLAVLHNDDVAACKSEIKWLEAANFSIPSVVSKTKNYLDVINQGEDGFVVSSEEEWYSTLKKLVENSDLRKSIGHKACERVRAEYSISALAKNIDQIVKNAVLDRLENKQKTNKKKIAIVNVFFPPSSRGGATRVVTDEFELLQQHYGNEFELVVFTADTSSPKYYDYNVYLYNGVRVHQVTVAYTEHTSNLEHDEKVKDLFENFLILEQPDLVHFHCIQALTASIVKATLERKIPYLVTIHDAWWISDYQFLTDKNNKVYPEGHPDIFEKIDLPENVSLEQSIKRRSHLKNLLMQSNSVLVVSETFKNIYHKNGIINAITNKNGISNSVHWQTKETEYTEKVICALIGGMSPHKGFDIFREAVNQFNGSNLEMLVVDHSKESAYLVKVFWGNTAVTIVGHVNQEDIVNLYKKIDVLFAPSICPESFGLVTREAMACGCWIVASDIGAIGEDVAVTNGFKIAPTEKNLLVTLNKLNKNPKKYKGISKSSQIRYSSDQVGELVDIFRELS
jgi:glycosyltransferase involved in cell wall biosynthesis